MKSWTSALRAALRLAGTAAAAGRIGTATSKKRALPAKKKNIGKGDAPRPRPTRGMPATTAPAKQAPIVQSSSPPPGHFAAGRFRNRFGTRAYHLYRPTTAPANGMRPALIVMLHGCAQDAERFAATTRMAQRAQAHGAWVLYPEQSAGAQRARCWRWFEPEHQRRGAGEPAILAGLVRKIVRQHRLDTRRVFVAGLSAGGAMALILGRSYPDVFRAVGVCAGMPYASARTAATALLAMRARHTPAVEAESAAGIAARPVRTIIFQGDRDRTVAASNADAIAAAALRAFGPTTAETLQDTAVGRAFQRTQYRDAHGSIAVAQWTVHGAGHAWPGGAPAPFSDPLGPDASAAMLEFFLDPGA